METELAALNTLSYSISHSSLRVFSIAPSLLLFHYRRNKEKSVINVFGLWMAVLLPLCFKYPEAYGCDLHSYNMQNKHEAKFFDTLYLVFGVWNVIFSTDTT